MKVKIATITLLLLISTIGNAGGPVLPSKWREPTEEETFQDYNNSHLPTLISGDFDGNGLVDGATIVITADNKKQELVVFMYSKNPDPEWLVLDSNDYYGSISMGLSKVDPGLQKVLCVTGDECRKGYKKEIAIKYAAINYFRPESANSIFVFSNGKFERIWQSD